MPIVVLMWRRCSAPTGASWGRRRAHSIGAGRERASGGTGECRRDRASQVHDRAAAQVHGAVGVRGVHQVPSIHQVPSVHEVPAVLTNADRLEAFNLISADPSIFTEDPADVFRSILGQSGSPFAFLRTGDPVANLTRGTPLGQGTLGPVACVR